MGFARPGRQASAGCILELGKSGVHDAAGSIHLLACGRGSHHTGDLDAARETRAAGGRCEPVRVEPILGESLSESPLPDRSGQLEHGIGAG